MSTDEFHPSQSRVNSQLNRSIEYKTKQVNSHLSPTMKQEKFRKEQTKKDKQ